MFFFADEIASFMPQPGDYSLDDLDEIIRSTDSHLDASLDLNVFSTKSFNQNDDFDMVVGGEATTDMPPSTFTTNLRQEEHQQQDQSAAAAAEKNEFHFNFSAFPSPATSHQSSGDYVSPFDTPARTSSTSSVDGDHFNPDDFINFLNDDDVKFEDLTHDSIRQLNERNERNERNTPSPTGSYTSSSGSSTSGIQSDVSSVASMSQNARHNAMTHDQDQDDLSEFIKFKNEKVSEDSNSFDVIEEVSEASSKTDGNFIVPSCPAVLTDEVPQSNTTLIPVSFPLLPMGGTIQPVQSVNIVQGTIIPVQTVPLTKVTPVVNVKTPAKSLTLPQQPIKVVTNTSSGAAKVSTPPNPKPKTIFLSSNDFKALMQKVNTTNGGTGSKKMAIPNGQTPKVIMKTASGRFITANKITTTPAATVQANATSAAITQMSATSNNKLMKTTSASSPMVAKHHSSKVVSSHSSARSAAAMAAARANLSLTHSKGSRPDFSSLRNLGDEKIIKKQLRMLKNRESASLSRKKKKEYVERLENRINNLEKENYSLKGVSTLDLHMYILCILRLFI